MYVLAIDTPLPEQTQIITQLTTAQIFFPIALCIIGGLLMGFGFKAYKWIVLLNFVAMGWWLGPQPFKSHIAADGSDDLAIVASVAGAVLLGVLAFPLLKYAVAACGGLVGFAMGMVIWAYCDQPLDMAWAGGLIGLAILGMLSFIWFKTTVILFTSVEGAAMFVFGTCALVLHYAPWQKQVSTSLDSKPILIPLIISTIAVLALFWQHTKHGLIGHDGAPPSVNLAGGGAKAGGGGGGGGEKKKA